MSAPHIEENVLDQYAMGTLPGERIPKVEEHLLSCSVCQTRLVETDEFVAHFRVAAAQVEVRPAPFWARFQHAQRLIWGGSAVLTAAVLLLLVTGKPQQTLAQPAMVLMQALRGPEAQAQIAKDKPSLLIFDVPVLKSGGDYEIDVVDTAGNEILKGNGTVKEDHLTFPIGKLAPAAYWVRVYQKQPAKVLVEEYGLLAK
jgi:hypothetical protein